MKRKGRHPENALTALGIRSITTPGKYADGNGLYLVVEPSGAKRWILRTMVHGRRRDIGLGGISLVSLAEAREQAQRYRKIARSGGDPVAEKRRSSAHIPTFEEAAKAVHSQHKASWRNEKHAAQWFNTLRDYAFPHFGKSRVDHVDTPDVLRALAPIWLTKPETARRVRQRIGVVLDWAKASGFRSEGNPVDAVSKGLPRQPERKRHHKAMPYSEVPGFIASLREGDGSQTTRLAFEFLILTAARTSEVLKATWDELDLAERTWTIPPQRMKAHKEHRVPLSDRAVELLQGARETAPHGTLVFPGQSPSRPLSNMALLMHLRRQGCDYTVHGFRSSFRDWASECTNFSREVCEMALAHTITNKAEAAYRRGDLFQKRRELMEAWSRYVSDDRAGVIRFPNTKSIHAQD